MKTVSYSEARQHLKEICDEVAEQNETDRFLLSALCRGKAFFVPLV